MENGMKLVTIWYEYVGKSGQEFRNRVAGLIASGTFKTAPYTSESSSNVWFGRIQVLADPDACQVLEGVKMMAWRDV